MKFTVLASGSKGNMTYIEFDDRAVLIDAGISLPNAQKRTEVDLTKVTDIFVTHEHGDHVKFLETVASKTKATIYINKKSFYAFDARTIERLSRNKIMFIEADSHYKLSTDIDFYTLKLSHDSASIIGYIFKSKDKSLGYITDTGYFPVKYLKVVSLLDAVIIEANHNIEMLMNSPRDMRLKERILSSSGHMSNYICFEVLKELIKGNVHIVVLAHISEECNSFECINEEILLPLKEIYQGEVLIASQNEATRLIEI